MSAGTREESASTDAGLVMLCVRVPPSLRRRVRLAAVTSGCTIQQLAVDALEDACRRHGS